MVAMSALAFSIVASVVLTIVLNVALRLFPGAGQRASEAIARLTERSTRDTASEEDQRRVRVIVPWKAMLLASLALTLLLNLLLVLRN
jgi:hypothetical protein